MALEGTLRFIHRLLRSLTLPSNAGDNDPAIIISPDVRAEIIAFYNALGYDAIGMFIFQVDRDHYTYLAHIIPQAPTPVTVTGLMAFGTVQFTTAQYRVLEAMQIGAPLFPSQAFVAIGAVDVGAQLFIGGSGFGDVQILSGAQALFQSGSLLDIATGAQLFLNGLGFVESGAALNVNPGGTFNAIAGSDLTNNGLSFINSQTYTPTLANVTLGTGGTSVARYHRLGDLLFFYIHLSFGAGGALTGNPTATLPQAVNTTLYPAGALMGQGEFNDSSLATRYPCDVIATGAGAIQWRYYVTSGANATYGTPSAAAPFAIASGDDIWATGAVTLAA